MGQPPIPPAIELARQEEDLQARAAVEVLLIEDHRVEADHRDAERVVPHRPPGDQHDVGKAETGSGDFKRFHTGFMDGWRGRAQPLWWRQTGEDGQSI
jgi:hypothetical protein